MTIWKAKEFTLFNAFVKREMDAVKMGMTSAKQSPNTSNVFKLHNRIDKLIYELRHQIEMLSVIDDFVAVRSHLKLYIITWHTLSDVTAGIINEVHDLGIAEKDLNLMMILRNRHIQESSLPKVFKKYKEKIRVDDYAKMRNDIVHRGFLPDDELDDVYGMFNTASLRSSPEYLALQVKIPTLPKATSKDITASRESLKDYLQRKVNELSKHLDFTEEMLVEVVELLSEHVLRKVE